MLASPFRKSTVAGNCKVLSSPEGVTSWSSLITLNEGIDEDEEVGEHDRLAEMIMARNQGQRVAVEDTCSMILPQTPPLFSALKKFRLKKKSKSLSRRAHGIVIFSRTREDEDEEDSKKAELSILPTVPETTEAVATPELSRLEEVDEDELKELASGSSARRGSVFKRSFLFK
ncbi:hypothetical protein Aperf_G00000016595 [Anoplocephala perfoliata]